MSLADPILLTLVFVAVAAILWWRSRGRRSFAPTNDLERLLWAAVGSPEHTRELKQQLVPSTLFAIESPDKPDFPMDLTLVFPPEFADRFGDHELNEDGKIQFGPWIVCFTSRAVVDVLAADPIMGGMVTEVGSVRTFPARDIFRSALDRRVDIVLNPFFDVSRRLSQAEIQDMVKTAL